MANQDEKPLRVTIVDRNRLYRSGLKLTLEAANVSVVADVDDLDAAAEAGGGTVGSDIDIVLLRLLKSAPVTEVLETARRTLPRARLVFIADANVHSEAMVSAIRAGVDGILLSDLSPDAFLQSLRLVRLGEKVLPAQLARLLICDEVDTRIPTHVRQLGLSARELEILRLLMGGDSNKGIARHLDIAEATVKVHVKAILRKIQVTNRTQAAVWALNHGMACER